MMSKLDYFKVIVQTNKSLKAYNVAGDGDLDLNIILNAVIVSIACILKNYIKISAQAQDALLEDKIVGNCNIFISFMGVYYRPSTP